MTLLGIALAIFGIVCLVAAAIWVFVWPSNKPAAPHPPLGPRARLAAPGGSGLHRRLRHSRRSQRVTVRRLASAGHLFGFHGDTCCH